MTRLRPQLLDDLPLLGGGDSPFDDFGPKQPSRSPRPSRFDEPGALTVLSDEGEVAGEVSWHWERWGPNEGSRCLMIGIWLRPSHRGRGIGTDAQTQLVDLIFRHTPVNRVEAHTDIENVAEQRALEAAGFQREGVIRGGQWRDGEFRDGVLYSALRHDPRPSR